MAGGTFHPGADSWARKCSIPVCCGVMQDRVGIIYNLRSGGTVNRGLLDKIILNITCLFLHDVSCGHETVGNKYLEVLTHKSGNPLHTTGLTVGCMANTGSPGGFQIFHTRRATRGRRNHHRVNEQTMLSSYPRIPRSLFVLGVLGLPIISPRLRKLVIWSK